MKWNIQSVKEEATNLEFCILQIFLSKVKKLKHFQTNKNWEKKLHVNLAISVKTDYSERMKISQKL